VSVLFFLFARGYKSAVLHDGKIRADDIIVPAIFSASVLFVMVFFFSVASFNV
jgi:ABC-type multidrug transport system permease subunit